MKAFAMHVTFLLWAIWVSLNALPLSAQQATLKLDPDEIRIGEHTHMLLDITIPVEGEVIWPPVDELLGKDIELIREETADTLTLNTDSIRIRRSFMITSWEDGYFPVPPVEFKHILEQDTTVFESRPVLLQVADVEVDLEEDIQDIRPIISVPLTFWEVFLWMLAGVVLVLLIIGIYLWRRKRGKQESGEQAVKPREEVPAHIAAISSLETLRKKKLWQDGRVKEHYMELTDIIRLYIGKRYGFAAPEMTTGEILHIIPSRVADERILGLLSDLLHHADLVKFAKHQPGEDKHEKAVDKALAFVSGTVPAENDKNVDP